MNRRSSDDSHYPCSGFGGQVILIAVRSPPHRRHRKETLTVRDTFYCGQVAAPSKLMIDCAGSVGTMGRR